MVSDDDAIAALDVRLVTITEDDEGRIHLNHQGMDEPSALWMLESAKHLILSGYWFGDDEEEEEED